MGRSEGRRTHRQRVKDNHRRWASKHLELLLVRQGYRCHWCRGPLAHLRALQQGRRLLHATANTVYYLGHDGREARALVATADHLNGCLGERKLEELVAACASCNRARGAGILEEELARRRKGGNMTFDVSGPPLPVAPLKEDLQRDLTVDLQSVLMLCFRHETALSRTTLGQVLLIAKAALRRALAAEAQLSRPSDEDVREFTRLLAGPPSWLRRQLYLKAPDGYVPLNQNWLNYLLDLEQKEKTRAAAMAEGEGVVSAQGP